MSRFAAFPAAVLTALLFSVFCAAPVRETSGSGKKILEREKSRFGLVSVYDAGGNRYLSIGEQEQSAVNLAQKREWVYTYMYLLSLGILAVSPELAEKPADVLIIGLGGGSFADFLAESYPRWNIEVVEINPAVIRLAKKYFPIDGRVRIFEDDGRAFLGKGKKSYHVIVMDAFGEHYIPPELYTAEYFRLMKGRLADGGLVLMNTWEGNPLEASEISTLRSVFGKGYYIHDPRETPGNRIYILGTALQRRELKDRILTRFAGSGFTGSHPGRVTDAMTNLSDVSLRGEVLTDKNVRAYFRQNPKFME